ncbi:MAG: hypothetical protein WBA17_02135, partial [Saprospiraceae bacterium]
SKWPSFVAAGSALGGLLFILLPGPARAADNPLLPYGREAPVVEFSVCTPGEPVKPYTYRFVNPAIVGYSSDLAPYFLAFGDVYEVLYQGQDGVMQADNVDEWVERYCDQADAADINAFVYQYPIRDLEALLLHIQDKDAKLNDLSPTLRQNEFSHHLFQYNCDETVRYLIFAKRCEPHVVAPSSRWDTRRRDLAAMRSLIEEGKTDFYRAESHYIRLRYAYQLVRLAHYMLDYQGCLDLYDELMPKVDADPSLVYYWVEGHRAGALRSLGRNAEAAYLFSRVFDQCPSKRESAYLSFRINSNEEWRACLLLCKNQHEQATLYVLRAQNAEAELVEEMQSIYALEPRNKVLEILLVREMQRLESDLLGIDFNPEKRNNSRHFNIPRPVAGERVVALQQFVRQVRADNVVDRPQLWQLAETYLQVLAGDRYAARKSFSDLRGRINEDSLVQQYEIMREVMNVVSLDTLTDSLEVQYYRKLSDAETSTRYPDLAKLINDKFLQIYKATNRKGKAYLLEYRLEQLRANPQIDVIRDLITLAEDENANRFEKKLLTDRLGTDAINELRHIQAVYYISNSQLEAAFEIFRLIPEETYNRYGQYAPFVARLNDCVNCGRPDTARVYNKFELMQELINREYDARSATDPNRSAELYFQVGVAYYNMTYFGHMWKFADFFRSSVSAKLVRRSPGENVFPYYDLPLGNREYFDCSRAQSFFDRSHIMATDPELAARAAFYAAKCERNLHYATAKPGVQRPFTNFALLRDKYSNTRFYQRAIAECRTFAAFTAN